MARPRKSTGRPARAWIGAVLSAIAPLAAGTLQAHEFCVGTAANLQDAFDAASDNGMYNGEDNVVRLQAATFSTSAASAFRFNSSAAHTLQVLGGWNDDCSEQSLDPALSVLDGGQATYVLSIVNGGDTTISYITIQNGREPVGLYAAGLTLQSSSDTAIATVSWNIIRNNYATETVPIFTTQPAGIEAYFLGGLYLMNNLIAGNTSEGTDAAGDIVISGNDCVTNNTVVDNTATNGGDGGLLLNPVGNAGAYVINNVFWGNTHAGLIIEDDSNLMQNNDWGVLGGSGSPGNGSADNLSVAPQFVDRPNGNYRLGGNSPLLGKGNNAPECGLPARDLDGHPRVLHGIVDIGAYQESVFNNGFEPAA
jgi:hypothetical protein